MPTASQITLMDECHSFVSEKSTEKRGPLERIPRPPNAFILFRSDLLKRRAVPPEVEKRQQNLSRIAGQCWNMLSETEKAIWFSKAAVIRAEHRAKYAHFEVEPFRKNTKRLSAKDKRRGTITSSTRPFDRFRTRRTRTLYCEGMFAALHDPKISSPEPQASLLSSTPVSESSLSTTNALSLPTLPDVLSPSPSLTYSTRQSSLHATPDSGFCYLLDSPGSEIPQGALPQIMPNEIGSLREPIPTLQHLADDFASGIPFPDLEQFHMLQNKPSAQAPLTLPASDIFPSVVDFRFLSNDLDLTGNFTHFNQTFIPSYPWP